MIVVFTLRPGLFTPMMAAAAASVVILIIGNFFTQTTTYPTAALLGAAGSILSILMIPGAGKILIVPEYTTRIPHPYAHHAPLRFTGNLLSHGVTADLLFLMLFHIIIGGSVGSFVLSPWFDINYKEILTTAVIGYVIFAFSSFSLLCIWVRYSAFFYGRYATIVRFYSVSKDVSARCVQEAFLAIPPILLVAVSIWAYCSGHSDIRAFYIAAIVAFVWIAAVLSKRACIRYGLSTCKSTVILLVLVVGSLLAARYYGGGKGVFLLAILLIDWALAEYVMRTTRRSDQAVTTRGLRRHCP